MKIAGYQFDVLKVEGEELVMVTTLSYPGDKELRFKVAAIMTRVKEAALKVLSEPKDPAAEDTILFTMHILREGNRIAIDMDKDVGVFGHVRVVRKGDF